MLRTIFFSSIIIMGLLGSCSFNNAPTEMFSSPNWEQGKLTGHQKKIVIASTNNFRGKLNEEKIQFPSLKGLNPYQLKVGGVAVLKTYIDILKYRFGKNLVLLDTGHIFNMKKPTEKTKILQVYQEFGYDGVNLTDVDFKALNILKPKDNQIPFITSNIIDLEKSKPTEEHNVAPYKIIEKDGINIGIVALTSYQKVDKKDTKAFTGYYFEDPVLSFLKIKKIFQKKGVDLILLMPSVENYEELKNLVNRLPPNSVDVIVSGNTFTSNTQIKGIPLLQNPGKGQYISRIELIYDLEDRVIIKDKTFQPQPTKICHNFFEITMDCHNNAVKDLTEARAKLIQESKYKVIPAKFLGHEVKKNDRIDIFVNN